MLKKISILFLFIIMLISIGGVCASDSTDITVDTNLGTIYTDDINDVSDVSTDKSFDEIQNLIGTEVSENKEINLSGVYTGDKSIHFKIKNGATLTINGEDGTVLDGQYLTRIFAIEDSNGILVLNNLKLTNSYVHGSIGGGAIYSDGVNLFLNNCTFYNHYSTKGVGGAVGAYGVCQVNVNNCIFENCTALGGGAIAVYEDDSELNVINSTFKNNLATDKPDHDMYYSGGAILSKGTTKIIDSIFINNRAPFSEGGAISTGGTTVDFTVIGCIFYNNSANAGGAISANKLNLKNSYFELNHIDAMPKSGKLYGGGAIDGGMMGVELNAENSTFISNYIDATKVKGFSGGAAIHGWMVKLKDCYFEGNYIISKATVEGGAIYSENSVIVKYSTFINNSCPGRGGAIFTNNRLKIYSSTFINNTAKNGGAIACLTKLYVVNSSFINNKASNNGGAIFLDTYYTHLYKQIVKNSIFVANSANNKGDAIYLDSDENKLKYLYKIKFNNCYWGHNYLTKESFLKSGLITYKFINLVPNKWILMNLKQIAQKDNIKVYKLTLNTKTNGKKLSKSYAYLPDYTVNLKSVLGNQVIPSKVTIKNGKAIFALIKTNKGKDILKVYDPDSSKLLLSSDNLPHYDKKPVKHTSSLPNAGNPLVVLILALFVLPILRRKL